MLRKGKNVHGGGSVLAVLLAAGMTSGCGTIRRAAMNQVADTLAGPSAGGVFASDDDPELIRDALPFGLKLQESLLAANPTHRGLHLACARGFVQYANAFVDAAAEREEDTDYEAARAGKLRAGKLYRRGRDYALRGLELSHPGFAERLAADPKAALSTLRRRDVDLLYWAGAGWAGAIAANPSDMEAVGELPVVEALMRRALALDEAFDRGAIHEFFITYEGSRGAAMGGSAERAREHYRRAVALQRGRKASPHVALAASVAVKEQDIKLFRDLLAKALAVDVDAVPEWRLANILSQRKARWLLGRMPDLFVAYEEESE